MPEVPIAWPPDRVTAEVIASRLRAEGIVSRIDIGLWQGYEVPTDRGQVTVFVSERDARRARDVLEIEQPRTMPPDEEGTSYVTTIAIGVGVGAVLLALVLLLTRS